MLLAAVVGYIFFDSYSLLVSTWSQSTTFEHSFFIAPIAFWLMYRKRYELAGAITKQSIIGYFTLLVLSFFWLIGQLSSINAISQFALMSMPMALVLALWGWGAIKILRFPLFFLILSVPFGEFLIPVLQEVTADISIYLLKLVQLPIYREGLYIHIPAGIFHVAEACSGIRFLFSTITMGLLITHLQIRSRFRQAVFMLLVVLIPIIANGLRVFFIVVIGHLSDMQAAVGFDHIVYGWVFFCIVIIIVISVGNLISDESINSTNHQGITLVFVGPSIVAVLLALTLILSGPAVYKIYSQEAAKKLTSFDVVNQATQSEGVVKEWAPQFGNTDVFRFEATNKGASRVELYQFGYITEDVQKEMVSWHNRLYSPERWSEMDYSDESIAIGDIVFKYRRYTIVNSTGRRLQLVESYEVADKFFANKYHAKLYQIFTKITFLDLGGNALVAGAFEGAEHNELASQLYTFYLQAQKGK